MGVHEKNLKYNLTEIDYEFHYFIKNVRDFCLNCIHLFFGCYR